MSWLTKISIAVVVLLVVIQFFRPARNTSSTLLATDITKQVSVPDDVLHTLQTSCYDCHSNNTQYPWYMNVQPVAWFLAHHVSDGKEHLNFSEFGSYSLRRQQTKLKEVAEVMEDDSMPLWSYLLIHRDAKLSEETRNHIKEWALQERDKLGK